MRSEGLFLDSRNDIVLPRGKCFLAHDHKTDFQTSAVRVEEKVPDFRSQFFKSSLAGDGVLNSNDEGRTKWALNFLYYCVVPENIHIPTTEGIGNSEGEGRGGGGGSKTQEIPEGNGVV